MEAKAAAAIELQAKQKLQEEAAELNATVCALKELLAQKDKQIAQLQADAILDAKKLDALRRQLADQKADFLAQQTSNEATSAGEDTVWLVVRLAEAQATLEAQWRQKLEEEQALRRKAEAQLAQLQAEMAQLQAKLEESQAKLKDVLLAQQQAEAKEAEEGNREELLARIAELEALLAAAREAQALLEAKVQLAEAAVQASEKAVAEARTHVEAEQDDCQSQGMEMELAKQLRVLQLSVVVVSYM